MDLLKCGLDHTAHIRLIKTCARTRCICFMEIWAAATFGTIGPSTREHPITQRICDPCSIFLIRAAGLETHSIPTNYKLVEKSAIKFPKSIENYLSKNLKRR